MSNPVHEQIDSIVKNNKIVIFMKGIPQAPQCGFSAKTVEILNALGKPYEAIDVLADAEIRQGIKEYSNWPTIPQVFVDGEFVGGCDIIIEMAQRGDLQKLVGESE